MLAAAATALWSQEEPREQFEEVISVVEVEIPVRVMQGGQPLTGLTRENFRVFDRGQERPVVGFRVVDLTTARTQVEDVPTPSIEAGSMASGAASERFFLAIFDTINADRARLAQAVRGLRAGLLENLHPTDRVGIAVLDSRGPVLLLGFTSDPEALDAALDFVDSELDRRGRARKAAAKRLQQYRASNLAELAELVGPSAALALADTEELTVGRVPTIDIDFSQILIAEQTGGRLPGGIEEAFAIGEEISLNIPADRISLTSDALVDLATLFRRLRGQKHLLLLSGGIESYDTLVSSGSLQSGLWTGTGPQISRDLERISETFRRTGWQIDSFVVGDYSPISDIDGGASGVLDSGFLGSLAAETGGELYDSFAQSEDAFTRLAETTEVTYWLTFQADDLYADADFRRIRVELVDVSGRARVHARRGYFGQVRTRPSDELEDRLEDSEDLLYGLDRRDFPVETVAMLTPAADGQTRVSILAWVAAQHLVDGADTVDLAIQGVAQQPETEVVVDLFSEFVELDVSEHRQSLATKGLLFLGDVVVPDGAYRLRFRLANRGTGQAHLGTLPLTVAATEQHHPVPMILQAEGTNPLFLHERDAQLALDEWSPLVADRRMFLPTNRVRLADRGVLPVHIKLFGEWTADSAVQTRLRSIADDSVREVPLEVHRTEGLASSKEPGSLLASVRPSADTPPGHYSLEVVWDNGSSRTVLGSWPVEVVSSDP